MTKKILFSLAISLVAMASCNNTPTPTATASAAASAQTPSEITIAYVNVDSLISQYQFYIDANAKYQAKADKASAELESKGRSFQTKAADFQNKAQKGLITRAQGEEMGANLEKEQQNLVAYRDKMLAELGEEEQVLMNNVVNNINEYLKKYNADGKYTLILNKSSILNGSTGLDITGEILEGINSEYTPATEK